jgi:hypothetical protein
VTMLKKTKRAEVNVSSQGFNDKQYRKMTGWQSSSSSSWMF